MLVAVTIFLTLLGICRIFIQEEDLGTVIVIRVESMSHLEAMNVVHGLLNFSEFVACAAPSEVKFNGSLVRTFWTQTN